MLVAGPVHPIDQKNVLPAITVVIEECTPGTQSLGKELPAKRSAVVPELNASARAHINKPETRRAGSCHGSQSSKQRPLRHRRQAR